MKKKRTDRRGLEEEDQAPAVRAQAAALAAARELKDRIIDLIRNGRRLDGVTRLTDVAIAVRVGGGCLPSKVSAIRAELLAAGEEVAAP